MEQMMLTGLKHLLLLTLFAAFGYRGIEGRTVLVQQTIIPTAGATDLIPSQPATYPATPVFTRQPTTIPTAQNFFPPAAPPDDNNANNPKAPTIIPTADLQSSSFSRPFTPSRVTAVRTQGLTAVTSIPTTVWSSPDNAVMSVPTTLLSVVAVQTTVLPAGFTFPASTPQHVLVSFNNKYSELGVNDYDAWGNRQSIQGQLSHVCSITSDRITDVSVQANSTGYLVIEFTIRQGYPMYIADVVQMLKTKLESPNFLQLSGKQLNASFAVFWTDKGPCPIESCQHGLCDVSLTGSFSCQCDPGYSGSLCQYRDRPSNLFALLVLLIIPVGIAVGLAFYFGMRRQQKRQLKRTFDLRDVRTIGPKSMLSLPQEQGMRNQMYDTRSFALAFTDESFKTAGSSSAASSEDDLISHMGK